MILTDKQILKHVSVNVGDDGVWIELKANGKSYCFQPIQTADYGLAKEYIPDWCNEIQKILTAPSEKATLSQALPKGIVDALLDMRYDDFETAIANKK